MVPKSQLHKLKNAGMALLVPWSRSQFLQGQTMGPSRGPLESGFEVWGREALSGPR